MDPSVFACALYDTLTSSPPPTIPLVPYHSGDDELISSDAATTFAPGHHQHPVVVPPNSSIFDDVASIKLGNIDAVTTLTEPFSLAHRTSITPLNYAIVSNQAPPLFQYMNYRFPNGHAYIGSNVQFPETEHIHSYNYNDDAYEYINFALNHHPEGLDVVIIDLDIPDDTNISFNLLIHVGIAVATTKIGGNTVIRLPDIEGDFFNRVLYVLANSFDEIYILNPLTAADTYFIGKNRKSAGRHNFHLIDTALRSGVYPNVIFEQEVPLPFIQWLSHHHHAHAQSDVTLYNNKLLLIWNLPESPDPRYHQLITHT